MPAAQTEIVVSMNVTPIGPCSLHVCRTWDELEQFRESWNELLQFNPASSIFLTPEWLAAWWQAFAGPRQLRSIIFSNPEGRIVGIAPLYTERKRFFGRKLTYLRMLGAGSGDSDALDFIILPGYENACADAFTEWLARQSDWDICALETLPQNSFTAKHLVAYAQRAGWTLDSTLTPNFVVELPPTWQEYLNSLEPAFRPLLTRYPKRLQSRFSVRLMRCEHTEDLGGHLDRLFSLHQMRWTGRGKPGAFANPQRRDFYLKMASAFLQCGWLEFWLLELNEEIVGAQFCFRYKNTVSLLQEGFHPKYTAEKIGYALRSHVLKEMIGSGAKLYDFLGGDDPYKAKFGAHQQHYLNLFFAGSSRMGRASVAFQKNTRRIKHWLKSKLPASWLARPERNPKPRTPAEAQ